MAKPERFFVCQSCGQDFPRWAGQCPACQEWNSLVEEKIRNPKSETLNKSKTLNSNEQKPIKITSVDFKEEARTSTEIGEVDRVLGGGVVAGSVVLVSGEPGIGKSTLMLQIASMLGQKATVLYVSGEESVQQVRLRAQRLGTLGKNLLLFPETNLSSIEEAINNQKPQFVVVDSIQTISRDDLSAAPGSVSQVRECAAYLVRIAKSTHIPIFIVGHVTKEGNIAGPRILEHVVDTVLYFEGEQHKQYRILRVTKNRFGSTNEAGIFEMKESGLEVVANPSQVFLAERPQAVPGSVVTASLEGSRPLLVEIQALSAFTKMPYPQRKVTGVDYNRAVIIIAVLERQLGLKLSDQDIYVNAAGGVKVYEPAIDLPVAVAIASSFKDRAVAGNIVVVGEVGLAGEVRSVSQIELRAKEAEKLGFKKIIVPLGQVKQLAKCGIEVMGAGSVKDALNAVLDYR
ncbi:DNA repair protein RadA [Candidatus Saganbacteria bacterium]|nr:DNA repair protein RadA [Candidatus Saganbacteria bacterium]